MIIETHEYSFKNTKLNVAFDSDVFINATSVAKGFKKQASKWLENKQTIEYIEAVAKSKKLLMADLVKVSKGGNDLTLTGTWIHPKLAVVFARWINPHFAVWCDEKIEELLNKGYVGATDEIQKDLDALAPHVKSIKKYIRSTGGIKPAKLVDLFSRMEKGSRTIMDYKNTLSRITSAASSEKKEEIYNKFIRGIYAAFNKGVIERRTQEDLLQIVNANLIKLLRRRLTEAKKAVRSTSSDSDINKYLTEINELKGTIGELENYIESNIEDPRPVKFTINTQEEVQSAIDTIKAEGYKVVFLGKMENNANKVEKKHPDFTSSCMVSDRPISGCIWTNEGYYFARVNVNVPPFAKLVEVEVYQHKDHENMYVGVDNVNRNFATYNEINGAFLVYRKQ